MAPIDHELIRHATLEFLAVRHPAAYPVTAILRRVAMETEPKLVAAPVEAALAFLEDKGFVRHVTDGVGSTKHFQATAAGVLAVERGEV